MIEITKRISLRKTGGQYKKNRKSFSVCFKDKPPESMNYKKIWTEDNANIARAKRKKLQRNIS